MTTQMFSVELEATNYADDTYLAPTLTQCVDYLRVNGYFSDEWRIALIEVDEAGCVSYCHDIISKEYVKEHLRVYRWDETDNVINQQGETISFSAALALMNDDICSRLNAELAPCDNQTLYDAYCREHLEVYGEEFIPDIGGAW